MKVEIRNLGVVKQAEIDLKPLTIFVGPNNTGKTWTAYALAAILGRFGYTQYLSAYEDEEVQQAYPLIDDAIQQAVDEGSTQIDLVQFVDEYAEVYINDVARLAPHWMREFMGTHRDWFKELQVRVRLEETKEHLLERIRAYPVDRHLAVGRKKRRALLNLLKEEGDPTLYFYSDIEGGLLQELPLRAVRRILAGEPFMALHRNLHPDTFPLPTERTTFITLKPVFVEPEEVAFEIKLAPSLLDTRHFVTMVSNFVDWVVTAFWSSRSEREEQAKNNPAIRKYIEVAELMETNLLGGTVDFSTLEPEAQRQIFFQPAEDVHLEMPIVSSMVKELSPLVLYLRYLAEPDEWLVMDEPEMNLHPEAQVRIIEFLAMLIHSGLHVLVTTHSPYVVDHLMNLMKAAEHEDKEKIREKFYLQRTEAFIPKEQVSIYLFGDGTAKNILDEEGLIDWRTFSRVSDRISQIYFEL